MIVAEFIRFYPYTLDRALHEYARPFFALVNSMYQIQANEQLSAIRSVSVGMAGSDGQSTISALEKQRKGLSAIVEEVKLVDQLKGDD